MASKAPDPHEGGSLKILILGHGNHGKGSVRKILSEVLGISIQSSSEAAAPIVYELLKDKYGYKSIQECFEDRRQHRDEWAQIIDDINADDKATMTNMILAKHDGYDGMRKAAEFAATDHLFDVVYFVDASDREPPDSSMTIEFNPSSMIRIDNNGPEDELRGHVLEAVSGI